MQMEQVEGAIQAALVDGRPVCISLNGAWGCGKTYFWDKWVKKTWEGSALPSKGDDDTNAIRAKWARPAYASCFGRSLAEVKGELVVSSMNVLATDHEALLKAMRDLSSWGAKKLSKFIPEEVVAVATETIEKLLFRKQMSGRIVCLDDLERCPKDHLESVLGLASELKEQRGSIVVLILNEDEIRDESKQLLSRYREKVIDLELRYSPSVDQCWQMASSDDLTHAERGAREVLCAVGCSSIRVIQRAKRLLTGKAAKQLVRLTDDTQFEFGRVVGAAVARRYLSAGRESNADKSGEDGRGLAPEIEEELSSLGLDNSQELADLAEALVIAGFVSDGDFQNVLESLQSRMDAAGFRKRSRAIFDEAVDLYCHRMGDGAAATEKLKRLAADHAEELVVDHARTISHFLEDFGCEEQAKELAQGVIARLRAQGVQVTAQDPITSWRKPGAFDRVFDEAAPQDEPVMSLENAMRAMYENNSWGPAEKRAFLEADLESCKRLLTQPEHGPVNKMVANVMRFSAMDGEVGYLKQKLKEAAEELAAADPIDRVRAKAWGLMP